MKINKRVLISFCTALAIVVALQFLIQKREDKDVLFCRNLFTQMIKGSLRAERLIDWEHITMLGYNLSAKYQTIAPQYKYQFRATFIQGFGAGFVAYKAKPSFFTHWRIYNKDDGKVIVACDYPRKKSTLLFTISKNGEDRKLTSIDWRQ